MRGTHAEEGRLRATCTAFIKHVVVASAKRLSKSSHTAKGSIKYVDYDVNRTYTVFQRDDTFAIEITRTLQDVDLKRTCGIICFRVYTCHHGLHLDKLLAESFLREMCDVDHPHVDIVRIHRADMLCVNADERQAADCALLMKLDGRDDDSIHAVFQNAVNIVGKMFKYRVGFLSNFGYFYRHASPIHDVPDNIITFVQTYSSSAKMVRPRDCGLVAAYAICRDYYYRDRKLLAIRNATRQYVRDFTSYCRKYIRKRQQLRIEEILTFDSRRLHRDDAGSISRAIERYGVFDPEINYHGRLASTWYNISLPRTGRVTSIAVSVRISLSCD